MYTSIRELSHQVDRSVQTLRRLERSGRIPKASREPLTRRRVWTERDAAVIRVILGARRPAEPPLHSIFEEAEAFLRSAEGQAALRRVQAIIAGAGQ